MNGQRRPRRAFTLVELLVVIAIIGFIACMLPPFIVKIIEAASRTRCIGDFNQIGKALESYSSDYGGFYPSWPGWIGKEDTWCRNTKLQPTTGYDCIGGSWGEGRCGPSWGIDKFRGYTAADGSSLGMRLYQARPEDRPISMTADEIPGARYPIGPMGLMDWRTVGYAFGGGAAPYASARYYPAPAEPASSQKALRFAPVGLGMLVVGNYLPDSRALYCPSSNGLPSDGIPQRHNKNWGDAAAQIADWRAARGYGQETLLYGNWRENVLGDSPEHVLQSHYAYRNAPFASLGEHDGEMWLGAGHWGNPGDGSPVGRGHWADQENWLLSGVVGVYPGVKARDGQPLFPTSKQLGSRALVVDTFSKGRGVDGAGNLIDNRDDRYGAGVAPTELAMTRQIIGLGNRGHKTAYSVLYGDWHVGIFNDPKESIIWSLQVMGNRWDNKYPTQQTTCRPYTYDNGYYFPALSPLLCNNVVATATNGPQPVLGKNIMPLGTGLNDTPSAETLATRMAGGDTNDPGFTGSAWAVWHEFDMRGGADVR